MTVVVAVKLVTEVVDVVARRMVLVEVLVEVCIAGRMVIISVVVVPETTLVVDDIVKLEVDVIVEMACEVLISVSVVVVSGEIAVAAKNAEQSAEPKCAPRTALRHWSPAQALGDDMIVALEEV